MDPGRTVVWKGCKGAYIGVKEWCCLVCVCHSDRVCRTQINCIPFNVHLCVSRFIVYVSIHTSLSFSLSLCLSLSKTLYCLTLFNKLKLLLFQFLHISLSSSFLPSSACFELFKCSNLLFHMYLKFLACHALIFPSGDANLVCVIVCLFVCSIRLQQFSFPKDPE